MDDIDRNIIIDLIQKIHNLDITVTSLIDVIKDHNEICREDIDMINGYIEEEELDALKDSDVDQGVAH